MAIKAEYNVFPENMWVRNLYKICCKYSCYNFENMNNIRGQNTLVLPKSCGTKLLLVFLYLTKQKIDFKIIR